MFEELNFWVFIAGPFISLLVGLLAKLNAAAGLKAVLNLGLSAVSGVILQAVGGTGLHADQWQQYLMSVVITWVTSIAVFQGFWKPSNIADVVQTKTASFGIGSPPDFEVDETPASPKMDEGVDELP